MHTVWEHLQSSRSNRTAMALVAGIVAAMLMSVAPAHSSSSSTPRAVVPRVVQETRP